MSIYRDADKDRWRFAFNRVINGRRVRASKLLPAGWNRPRAEAFDRKETGRFYAIATGIERQERLIDDAVVLYLKHKIPAQKSGKKAALRLASLLPFYEGRHLDSLAEVAQDYTADMAGILTAGTMNTSLAYLRAACRYGWKKHNLCDHDPTARMELPAPNNERHVYLRVREVNALLAKFEDKESAALFRLAFYTGLRWIAELLPRQKVDIKRLHGEVWLDVGETKNGSRRMVPIHPAAVACLRYLPFQRSDRTYYRAFQAARAAAGMEHVHAHDLRHSLASEIISTGGTLADVQAALAHRSVASAKRYAHLYPERMRAVMMKVGKR